MNVRTAPRETMRALQAMPEKEYRREIHRIQAAAKLNATATDAATPHGELISPNVILKPSGAKCWKRQIVSHSGGAWYPRKDVDETSSSSEPVQVFKSEEAISDPEFLASCEGAPLIILHGDSFVTPTNWSGRGVGFLTNVEAKGHDQDGNLTVVADVHIEAASAIDVVDNDVMRGISLAYTFTSTPGPEPGTYSQINLRCNHAALVPLPRMTNAMMTDSEKGKDNMDSQMMARLCSVLEKLLAVYGVEINEGESSVDDDTIAKQPGHGASPSTLGTRMTSSPSGGAGNTPVEDDSGDISATIANLQGGSSMDALAAKRCLDSLRQMRPAIEASRDLAMITGYNDAVTSTKATIRRLLPFERRRALLALDSPPSISNGQFEDAVREVRERMLKGEAEPMRVSRFYRPQRFCRQPAMDHGQLKPETFEEMMSRVRVQMLSGK